MMRWTWAWTIAAVWVAAATCSAAVTGRVTSIGFQSFIRGGEWTPLVVQTTSDEQAPHTYDLQVVQSDLDGDEVVYARNGITVNPGTQTFRTYFRPETVNGGLPASGSDQANELGKRLRVFLFDPATGKRAVRIGVSGMSPQALESGNLADNAGQKLILVVGRTPSTIEFSRSRERVLGLMESCFFVQVDLARLPESALAYAAADAVVWTDADATKLAPVQLRALRQYVQGGGTLAVIQNADFALTRPFADMLPVTLDRSAEWNSDEPLKSILMPRDQPLPRDKNGTIENPWRLAKPPYRMAAATVVDDTTIVDSWTNWPDGQRTPLIARRLFGLGCVAWLAEDISDPALRPVDFGWPRVWQRLFDWRDTDLSFAASESEDEFKRSKQKFGVESYRDLGSSFVGGMDPKGRTAALLSVAFVFFIGYWALAGPGTYAVLALRRKTHLSWFVFGGVAAVATVLTILISQLILRGDATAKHVSLVRVRAANEPARVLSRVGVYLPKDTRAAVALPITPDAPPSALSPFGGDPAVIDRDNVSPRDSTYEVAVGTDADATAVEIAVPFRSTLKKLQADWSGPVTGGIGGAAKVVAADWPIEGRVSNDTGADLTNVLLVFRGPSNRRGDLVVGLPDWKKGQTLDLKSVWQAAESKQVTLPSGRIGLPIFSDKPMRGYWSDALTYLYDEMRGGMITSPQYDDTDRGGQSAQRSFPIASLFARCTPMTNYANESTRVDLLRRGARAWDVSPAVSAGAMVVLAKSAGPLPLPLTVEGDPPRGDGTTFFQAILPIDRSVFNLPDAKDPDTAD